MTVMKGHRGGDEEIMSMTPTPINEKKCDHMESLV